MSTISSIDARVAQANISASGDEVSASVANLVSGQKKDANVADFSVGTVLNSRVGTLTTTLLNAGQAKNLLNTAKGALNAILSSLDQQKNLAVKAADDSLSNNERAFLDQEFQALKTEIDRIANNADFNGITLLDGSISGTATVASATGLATENYSIINNSSYEGAGTIASGDLVDSLGVRGENLLTFSAGQSTQGVITIYAGTTNSGNSAAGSTAISFGSSSTTDATASASAFATAANASTNDVARSFEFVDNGDGTVTVKAAEVGAHLNNYEFGLTTTAGLTISIGNNATTTDIDTAQIFTTNADTNTTGVDGVFRSIATQAVGQTRSEATLAFGTGGGTTGTTTITLTDEDGNTGTVSLSVTASEAGSSLATEFVAAVNASTNAVIRQLTFDQTAGTGNVIIRGAELGDSANSITIQSTTDNNLGTLTFGGDDVSSGGSAESFTSATTATVGADRSVTAANTTFDSDIIGDLSNFSATFNEGSGNSRNTATFSVEVNGRTFVSQEVTLFGTQGLNGNGSIIKASQDIVFFDADGPTSSSVLTDNAFALKLGTTDVTLSSTSTAAASQASLNTIADAFETQLDAFEITQARSLSLNQVSPSTSDHRVTESVGTILEGLVGFDSVGTDVTAYNDGDVRLYASGYGSSGTFGNVGSFSVDRLTDTVSTTINGTTYTAYLNSANAPTSGGVQAFGTDDSGYGNAGSYNATTKVLDLDDAVATTSSDAKLIFYSESTSDGNRLEISLSNVKANTAQIDISTNEGEKALEQTLNDIFGVADNDSLSFQVGAVSTDAIGVSIGNAQTTSLYTDDDGVAQTLSVTTRTNAQTAGDILDNAINTVVSLIADVDAAISSFNSAIANNQTSLQNADAARSILLDTDYSAESTRFAEARVKVDAATSILTQINTRIQNVLQLLRQ